MAAPEAFDVFGFDAKLFVKTNWQARVVQYPDLRIRVAGTSDLAGDMRRRAGREFGETAQSLLSGMSLFMIEDATAAEFAGDPAPLSTSLLNVDDLLLAPHG